MADTQMLSLVDKEIKKMSNRYPGLKSPLRYSEGAIDLIQVQRYFEEVDDLISDDSMAYKYMQYAEAYHVFQLCGIVHFDAKTENTVKDKRYGLQPIDFSTIKGKKTRMFEGNTGGASPRYADPELFVKRDFYRAQHNINNKTDIFSLGADLSHELLRDEGLSVWDVLAPLIEPILKPLLPEKAIIKLSNFNSDLELIHQVRILREVYEKYVDLNAEFPFRARLHFQVRFQEQLEIMIDHVLGIKKSDILEPIRAFKEFKGSKHSQSFLRTAFSCWFQLLYEERHDVMEVLEFHVAEQINDFKEDRDPLVKLAEMLLDNLLGNTLKIEREKRISILARMIPTLTRLIEFNDGRYNKNLMNPLKELINSDNFHSDEVLGVLATVWDQFNQESDNRKGIDGIINWIKAVTEEVSESIYKDLKIIPDQLLVERIFNQNHLIRKST